MSNKEKLLKAVLSIMKEKSLANTTEKDCNEKEREENKLFWCIYELFVKRVLMDSVCETKSIKFNGWIDKADDKLIMYDRRWQICCFVNRVQGVEFSTVIEETLEIFKSVNGFVTDFYGNDSDGYAISITGSIRGRN